jgi:hypothetical protein
LAWFSTSTALVTGLPVESATFKASGALIAEGIKFSVLVQPVTNNRKSVPINIQFRIKDRLY